MSLERPNWGDWQDRMLYDELFYHNNHGKPLTELEERFCTTMYHYEEYACGLDGDDREFDENDEEYDEMEV